VVFFDILKKCVARKAPFMFWGYWQIIFFSDWLKLFLYFQIIIIQNLLLIIYLRGLKPMKIRICYLNTKIAKLTKHWMFIWVVPTDLPLILPNHQNWIMVRTWTRSKRNKRRKVFHMSIKMFCNVTCDKGALP